MEKDKKIIYLRTPMLNSSRFIGKVVYLNLLVGTIAFIILTFFTDLPFTDVLLYNNLMYVVLTIQFLALVFFTLKHLWQYKVRKRYMQLKVIHHFKKIFIGNIFRKLFVILSALFVAFFFPIWIFYMSIYRELIRFGIVFFPYDGSLGRFAGDPVNTGNAVESVRSVIANNMGLNLLVVVYGFYLIILLFCLIRGK